MKLKIPHAILKPIFGVWFCLFGINVNGQTAQDSFGKNRIQFKDFGWNFLSTHSVDFYFYEGGQDVARTASEIAETEFKRISDLFGFTPYHKIKIFLYLSANDRLMSNIGLGSNTNPTGGKTNFTKSITEIVYNGTLIQLRQQISAGIAQILIRDMLFGGSLKDAVQNSYLLTLPDWFVGGAIRYASEGAGVEMEDFMREINQRKKLRLPSNFVGPEAYLIGQSIWCYIAEKYGRSSVGNILNLTRITRNEENAIYGTLGIPFISFLRDWKNHYLNQNINTSLFFSNPPSNLKIHRNRIARSYRQLQISPDGESLVYSQDAKGKFQLVVHNLKTGKEGIVFRGGSKVLQQGTESEFPLACFKDDQTLIVAYPYRGKWKGLEMNLKGRNRKNLSIFNPFHGLFSIKVSPSGKKLAVSGALDNFSDIFIFDLETKKRNRFTNDSYDDLDPFFSNSSDTVYFSSNRPGQDSATLKNPMPDIRKKLGLFGLPVETASPGLITKPKVLLQIDANLTKGQHLKGGKFLCISDEGGIENVLLYEIGKPLSAPAYLTASKFHVRDFAYQEDFRTLVYTATNRLRPGLYIEPSIDPSPYRFRVNSLKKLPFDSLRQKDNFLLFKGDSSRIDIRNYLFEEEKKPLESSNPTTKVRKERLKMKKETKSQLVEIQGPFPYAPSVMANHLTTGLVVNPIPSYGLGALVDFSMHDLFENHQINGGMTYFFTDIEMRNNMAFLEYQFRKYRLDFSFRMDRKSIQNSSSTQLIRQRDVLNGCTATFALPLSNALRIQASPYGQVTRRILFDRISNGLGGKDFFVYFYGISGELVFDNTRQTGINMLNGTRFKVRGQYQAAYKDPSRSFGEVFMDFRTYLPVHKEITLAFRTTFGQFFGAAPKKYSLGGMDNWLFRSYEVSDKKDDPLKGLNQNNLGVSSDEGQTDWLFNRYSTNLRGFRYNTAFGNSFLLFNLELRIPIVRYFYKGPIDSNFWRNLQITGFADVGTAWTGVGPLNKNNSLNTREIEEGAFAIKVKSYENPFLTGYGAGARTIFLGYYSKLDVAWGTQNGFRSKPQYFLTLGHDF